MDNKRKTGDENRIENNAVSREGGTRRVNIGAERRRSADSSYKNPYEFDPKRRLEQARKRERLRRMRLRALFTVAGAAVIMVILIFMTPLFNVREIRVEGNCIVSMDAIREKVGDLVGVNIFAVRSSRAERKVMEISQIEEAEITKHWLPPYITVTLKETNPAAYLVSGSNIIVINSDTKIIDDSGIYKTDLLPNISGISVSSYEVNEYVKSNSAEKDEILRELMALLEKLGMLDKVTYINLEDLTNIKFSYDNRLDVLCGSRLEMERKLRMFAEAINSDNMDARSIGTMDLSVPGQAVYTP